jgi:hypothetical protein
MLWMAFAIGAAPDAGAAEPTEIPVVDRAVLDTVTRALSSRDAVSCEAVEALAPDAVSALRTVVAEVTMPPYAPMRAADCLIRRHAAEVQPDLERWVMEPGLKGLGRLVLGALDAMPAQVAVPVVRKALAEGSEPELAARKAAAAVSPEIRALAVPR